MLKPISSMSNRRKFLQKSAAALGALTLAPLASKAAANNVAESLAELNTFTAEEAVLEQLGGA
mgnify:FL=1